MSLVVASFAARRAKDAEVEKRRGEERKEGKEKRREERIMEKKAFLPFSFT